MAPGQTPNPAPAAQNIVSLHDPALRRAVLETLSTPEGDNRPILLFLAGPNGAGKSSFFQELDTLMPGRQFVFVNADLIAQVLQGIPNPDVLAQKMADLTREHMLGQTTNFATETVFSDERNAKLDFLKRAADAGFRVVLVYVALANAHLSRQRVEFRVREGHGHHVDPARLPRRFIASRENCRRALYFVDTAILLDNSSPRAAEAFKVVAMVRNGKVTFQRDNVPAYIGELLPVATADSQVQASASSE